MLAAVKMSKKDGATRRLTRTIEGIKKLRELRSSSPAFDHDIDFDRLLNFDDPDSHATVARAALQIDPEERWTQPLRAAFNAFGLDPRNPFHWRKLLIYFAEAHFGKPPPGGRSRGWTDEKLSQLLMDFAQLKRANPGKNDSDICDALRKDKDGKFDGRYKNIDKKTIRRKLQDARNPKLNGTLRLELDASVAEWLPVLKAKVEPGRWTDDHERMVRAGLLTILIYPERLLEAAAGGSVRKQDRRRLLEATVVAFFMGLEVERIRGA